jgi:hypothetical protein
MCGSRDLSKKRCVKNKKNETRANFARSIKESGN